MFEETIDGANAIPQGYAVEEFHDEGILYEGAFAPLDVLAGSFPIMGKALVELCEEYDKMACFGFLIEDTSRGRVRTGPTGKPLITYWLNDHDVARIKRGAEILARIYFAAGAKRVHLFIHGWDTLDSSSQLAEFRNARISASDLQLTAYHPLGTARMGADARSSVIGPDHQAHELDSLYVVDGSALPTTPAVNPQVTIMALATRAAEIIASRLT